MAMATTGESTLRYLLGLDEDAYITATLLGCSAVIMFVSCWILGERHTHH